MSEDARRPLGKTASLAFATACGVADVIFGALGDSILPFLSLAAFMGAVLVFAIQLGDRPRRFGWIAWTCLVTSMLAICVVNLAVFGRHAAGC